MFKNKSKGEAPINESTPNSTSLIGIGTTVKGDIISNANMRIDGTVVGNINSTAKVIIGPNGKIEGDIIAQQADVVGKITGNVNVKELLQLKNNSVVNGNIAAGKLMVEPDAIFNGHCNMTNDAVNNLISDEENGSQKLSLVK